MANLKFSQTITRAGYTPNGRPVFTIMNITVIMVNLPRWYMRLVMTKSINPREVEFGFRKLKEQLAKNDLDLVEYSLYDEAPKIVVQSSLDGHPRDARTTLKTQLRLFNISMRALLEPFKDRVLDLIEYKYTNGKVIYCPFGKRPKRIEGAKLA